MVLSLGFGIVFAAIITLVLVPCLYLIIENNRAWLQQDELPAQPEKILT